MRRVHSTPRRLELCVQVPRNSPVDTKAPISTRKRTVVGATNARTLGRAGWSAIAVALTVVSASISLHGDLDSPDHGVGEKAGSILRKPQQGGSLVRDVVQATSLLDGQGDR